MLEGKKALTDAQALLIAFDLTNLCTLIDAFVLFKEKDISTIWSAHHSNMYIDNING